MVAIIIISPLYANAIHESKEPVNTPANNSTDVYSMGNTTSYGPSFTTADQQPIPSTDNPSNTNSKYQPSPNDLDGDGLLDNPDKPQIGPDPFCGLVRSMENTPIGDMLGGRYDSRCNPSASEDSSSLSSLVSQGQQAQEMISCAKKDQYNTFVSDNEKEGCDKTMLSIQSQCQEDSSLVFCVSTDEGFNPVEYYIERNNLNSDSSEEDNDSEDSDEED